VFVGGAAIFLTFFMLSSNDSIGPSALPLVAASDRPVSEIVLPWQAPTPQPPPTSFAPSGTAAPARADADMEVEAQVAAEAEVEAETEAGPEPFGKQPGYRESPPPNPPPGLSKPP
jgi:hypothetical protein